MNTIPWPKKLDHYTLSTINIKENALKYSRNLPVCLYVADCTSGNPKLTLVRNISKLDIEKLKELIWKRRFYNHCEGATENIILDFPKTIKKAQNISSARWSFYNDRFITNNGHFQGSYISQYPWKKCTENITIWGNKSKR